MHEAEALLNQFCAILHDRLMDSGRVSSIDVTWERHPTGCINIFIGELECYTIYPQTEEWVVTYFPQRG